jgi:hypothetical protein
MALGAHLDTSNQSSGISRKRLRAENVPPSLNENKANCGDEFVLRFFMYFLYILLFMDLDVYAKCTWGKA